MNTRVIQFILEYGELYGQLVGRIYNNLKDLIVRRDCNYFYIRQWYDAPIVSKYLDGEMEWGKGKTTDNGTHAPLVVSWKGHTKQDLSIQV